MIQLIRGFKDVLPGEVELWQMVEKTAAGLFDGFGFKEIRVPLMERTELFARSIGEGTDIVEKEMYTFADRKGEMITLRPEATASVVRAYIQHKLYAAEPVRKFYTIGPMFRRERPQKGRYRQFYQINAEVFGVAAPAMDAQLIYMLVTLLKALSVPDIHVHLNSLGCPDCRPGYKAALEAYAEKAMAALCEDCRRRKSQNALRLLDCKVPGCRDAMADAPSLQDYLCNECKLHFSEVKAHLQQVGISYLIDKRLVRGLDYYTRTTFEIQTGALGAQNAVAGGGRYDGLVAALGGPDTPAIGFAIGFDRLTETTALRNQALETPPDVFIVALGDECRQRAFLWSCELSRSGIRTEMDFSGRSLKALMKRANRLQSRYVLIFGESELENKMVLLRDMSNSEQFEIRMDGIVAEVSRKLQRD
ncbi:MAG: histidine--tRNA ligase [Desulfobacterales bacterium]|jgi:histidyl-tRNA synthetase|nr:histidine--tRNA ligase [Desulfobacterales bacterium]